MQQNSLYVSSFDITLELSITGTADFYTQLCTHSFWQEFIPNFSFESTGLVAGQWRITESIDCTFSVASHYITSDQAHLKEVIVILETAFERYRQEKSLYTFHGAAIAKETNAIGLIGNLSGIGKSTMGAYAAQHGWEWIADEKFTIFEDRIIGGTKGILNDEKTRSATVGEAPAFDTIAEYHLTLLCSPVVTSEAVPVRHSWTHAKKLWIYNDEISRDIRQVNGILSGFAESLQPLDDQALANERKKAIILLADNVDGAFLRGTPAAILKIIENIVFTK